jgi:hypothetical protein
MVDPLETFFVSWSQNRKQPLGSPENYTLALKDVANRVDSELNRSILLCMKLPARHSANLLQTRGDIFSEGWIMHESFRGPSANGTAGKWVSGIFGLFVVGRRSNHRWA